MGSAVGVGRGFGVGVGRLEVGVGTAVGQIISAIRLGRLKLKEKLSLGRGGFCETGGDLFGWLGKEPIRREPATRRTMTMIRIFALFIKSIIQYFNSIFRLVNTKHSQQLSFLYL